MPGARITKPVALAMMVSLIMVANADSQTHIRLTSKRPLMGTEVGMVLYAVDSIAAVEAMELAFARITDLNNLLSDYLTESELSQLSNTHNQSVQVSDDLWQVLYTAQEISHASAGAFDVTVGPLTLLWRRAMRRAMLPDSTDLDEAMTAVSYESLQLDLVSQTVRLQKDNMRIDLGGVAKGYIADQALEVLVREGFPRAAVDVGGDISLGDVPPHSDGWSVKVFSEESETGDMILKNCGIAVSGDSYRYLDYQGVKYSHILDPNTGYGVTHERKVAVIAPNAMIADAWASAYSVMDWRVIPLSIQEWDGLSIRIVEPDGTGLRELETGKFIGREQF